MGFALLNPSYSDVLLIRIGCHGQAGREIIILPLKIRGEVQRGAMTNYRRSFLTGGRYFFTVNLMDRGSRLLTENIGLLRAAFRYVRRRYPFETDAIVVLPDHMHVLWTLPPGDADFPTRWRLIKSMFSRSLPATEPVSASRLRKGERGIWQRRYWEHTIRDERDFSHRADYIHFNPVKHGHARRAADWPYSSFRRMARLGLYPQDWGGETVCVGWVEHGEPHHG